jgi:adenine-specific DNA-methyltransferase
MQSYSDHIIDGSVAMLRLGDAVEGLKALKRGSVDLIVTSPPYFIGKEYDTSARASDFGREIRRILPAMVRALKPGGSLCWQVGNHVQDGRVIPLDFVIGSELARSPAMALRNRIIWTFGHGTHASRRFSGRHETILWYTKGDNYHFELDPVRVPQTYPGKRHYKGPKKGDWSGNPLGKNPGDYWDIGEIWKIPNVNSNHVEKTDHPCQFPTALVRRLISALCPKGGIVVDPYMGSGSAAVAALLEGRNFYGSDVEARYLAICSERLNDLEDGLLKVREDIPVAAPNGRLSVATLPPHFRSLREEQYG